MISAGSPSRTGRTLETFANVLTAALLVGAAVWYFSSRGQQPAAGRHERLWEVKNLPIGFGGWQRTLVIALKPGCSFCTSSMPFYRELLRARVGAVGRVQVVVVSTTPPAETARYLASGGVSPDAILEVQRDAVPIRVVPALAIARSDGSTLYSFVGALPAAEEDVVKRHLFGGR
jgi:hypothetical protein